MVLNIKEILQKQDRKVAGKDRWNDEQEKGHKK